MEPGKPIRLRFVDAAAKPVPGVHVQIQGWGAADSSYYMEPASLLYTKVPERADNSGVWEWPLAPGVPVELYVYSYALTGFAPCQLRIAGGDPPRTVTLKAEHRITGRVTDAVTGKPIPLFAVIPLDVFRKDWLHAARPNARVGKDGRLDYLVWRTDIPLRLRVEALGYRSQTGPEFRAGDDMPRTQDFRLQPSEPITGTVLDAAGQPVAQAEVMLATPTEEVRLDDQNAPSGNHESRTDAAGRFTFPDPGEPFAVLAEADAGFALADFPAGRHDAGTLRLQAWASVRGQFRDGGKPVPGARIVLAPVRLDSLDRPRIDGTLQALTRAAGRFEFPRVPPGPVSVRAMGPATGDPRCGSAASVPLQLQPGQQAELDLGAGATVKGKVTLTSKVPAGLDCTDSRTFLVSRTPGLVPPPAIASAGFDVRKGWQSAWRKTPEGRAYFSTLRHWSVELAPDGAFRISGVPPGEYDLAVEVNAKASHWLVNPVAKTVARVTVTAADAARGELTVPEIAVAVDANYLGPMGNYFGPDGYRIEPPDVIHVEITRWPGGKTVAAGDCRVNPDGTLVIPKGSQNGLTPPQPDAAKDYGTVSVAGLTPREVEQRIVKMLLRQEPLNGFHARVEVAQYNSRVVYVITSGTLGDGVRPLAVNNSSTVASAILQCEGLAARAAKEPVWLAPPGGPARKVDWQAIVQQRSVEANYPLHPGDRIFIGRWPAEKDGNPSPPAGPPARLPAPNRP